MKVIEVVWFTNSRGCYGIVVGESELTKERKAFISLVSGNDEVSDTQYALEYGAVFPVQMAQRLVELLTQGGT